MTPDLPNELYELDQALQWLLPHVEDLETTAAVEALQAARQAAGHIRQLESALNEHAARLLERGEAVVAGRLVNNRWHPNRTGWDIDALTSDVRGRIVADPDGEVRSGSEVFDLVMQVQPFRGGSVRLKALAGLLGCEVRELDEYCQVGWRRRVDVSDMPEAA